MKRIVLPVVAGIALSGMGARPTLYESPAPDRPCVLDTRLSSVPSDARFLDSRCPVWGASENAINVDLLTPPGFVLIVR